MFSFKDFSQYSFYYPDDGPYLLCVETPPTVQVGRNSSFTVFMINTYVRIDSSVAKASHVDLAEKELEHMMIMRLLAALYKLDKYPNSLFLCIHSLKIM